jgi:hypothetical protein
VYPLQSPRHQVRLDKMTLFRKIRQVDCTVGSEKRRYPGAKRYPIGRSRRPLGRSESLMKDLLDGLPEVVWHRQLRGCGPIE